MPAKYVEKILRAKVYDVARETPLDFAPGLSARLGNTVLLKREDLQPVHSFKCRGAYNKMSSLDQSERDQGVIAASAGNHAQGVAQSASRLGIKALIVMPKTTPDIKTRSVKSMGAKVVLHGDSYDDAYTHALTLADELGLTFVHPYDDPLVIAGQGTVGMEILRQHGESLDAIFVPVGGGGLIAGVAAYVKHVHPATKIIGVEPVDAASMHDALAAKRRVTLKQVGLFTDGVAVKQVGKEAFRIARQCVDEIVLVDTDEICAAIKDIFEETRAIMEPAGALALAGLKRYVARESIKGQSLVAIESGANINFDRLRHVAERAEIGEHKEALLAVEIPERPGSFLEFCRILGRRSITEFNYRFAGTNQAHVFAGVELRGGEFEREELIAKLSKNDYRVVDLTENEMAKLHVRYMVGGHALGISNERVYRFEFPERPGALLEFLSGLGKKWNISLFHYRNHGAAFGRVMVGVQIDAGEKKAFQAFLTQLGYAFSEETDNPAYTLFAGTDDHV
ncbi:MAG TPA: threonine ammonia-lyase, biosynthetic [Chromatiaceae bacterium]|jgi:threonine dehydratase|nr:threonine ammonia-lyase, biosynthetic [Chromatiaceae bacterium]HIN81751.1 threonine ammonia-lyase, biosynthetic [Chromatiales bacterium]HIA07867.1 threonine ammonia-lyase, biosynthetic [Chromatiaceae bacterium]HIB84440.1 threonine ammonia-lyase, biosynthetic [Chromatiaceae bacterium]HIO14966.1 threonine ammonia-lyase, biosynthetic [Chromatiales bacterium]